MIMNVNSTYGTSGDSWGGWVWSFVTGGFVGDRFFEMGERTSWALIESFILTHFSQNYI